VILLDANLLIYAYHADTPQHGAATAWLEQVIGANEPVGVTWPSIWAFLRVSTNPKLWPKPMTATVAAEAMRKLLAQPSVIFVEPGPRHLRILEEVLTQSQALGPLVSDAVLAAIAIEHGATLASTDQDFSRFEKLRWINPLR